MEDEKDLRQNGSEKPFSGNRFLARTSFWDTGKHSNDCNRPALKAIPISELHQYYEEWKKRLQRCVASEGSYFEGDNVEL
ncbi:hypothetical protein TNCV_4499361 [Trichonephila clavipes]|nr:hypothetical protein TNCV_4499361 [Trichonephila clavipes]